MRRVVLYGMGWVVAAVAAVLLAWLGVNRVGTGITDRHARPLTADEARAALGTVPGAGGSRPAPGPGPSPGGNAGGGATTTTAPPRPTPTTAPRPPATTPSSPPTTRPSAPATPAPNPSPTPTPTPTTSGAVRTYNLIGGSATLRFDPSGKVTVVWANPNPGYRVEVDDRSDGGVRVRFDGNSHRSQVEAWWDTGPHDQVEESGGGGGGSGSG